MALFFVLRQAKNLPAFRSHSNNLCLSDCLSLSVCLSLSLSLYIYIYIF